MYHSTLKYFHPLENITFTYLIGYVALFLKMLKLRRWFRHTWKNGRFLNIFGKNQQIRYFVNVNVNQSEMTFFHIFS